MIQLNQIKLRIDEMTIDNLPDIVYHGTISIYKDSLLSGIDINRGYYSADFGQGFYTTGNYEQALRLARDRAKAYSKLNKTTLVYPMVVSYNINKSELNSNSYKGLIFDSPDSKWKEFIYNNRAGKDFVVSAYHNLTHKYDYVYGCVADSNITGMTKQIRSKQITYGAFADDLKPLKVGHYNQLSFHSLKSIKILDFLNIEIIESEVSFV